MDVCNGLVLIAIIVLFFVLYVIADIGEKHGKDKGKKIN